MKVYILLADIMIEDCLRFISVHKTMESAVSASEKENYKKDEIWFMIEEAEIKE